MMMRMRMTTIVGGLIVAVLADTGVGQGIVNGSFTNGLDPWDTIGDVQIITGVGRKLVRFEESHGDGLNPTGGRSALWQDIDIPVGTTEINFRYALVSGPGRTGPVPADSFTAHLLAVDGASRLLPVSPSDPPDFSLGYFYVDADGNQVYDNNIVSVDSGPGPDGMVTVRLDVTDLTGPARLEFGFASADNGATTYVDLDAAAVSDRPPCDADTTDPCGITSTEDCRWRPPRGDCDRVTDPVLRRMCHMGIFLDGNVHDAIAAGATVAVDQVPDVGGASPGPTGYQESPRMQGDPNGINIAATIVLYAPDSDPTDAIDDSFLYLGFDLPDYVDEDGQVPVPFDSDDDGCASRATVTTVDEDDSESYSACIDLCPPSTVDITDSDCSSAHLLIQWGIAFGATGLFNRYSDATGSHPSQIDIHSFPTGDSDIMQYQSGTNPTNACIDREIRYCARGNDFESVVTRIETRVSTLGTGFQSPRDLLSRLQIDFRGASAGDGGNEEESRHIYQLPLPTVDCHQFVMIADDLIGISDSMATGEHATLINEVRNSGNEDLDNVLVTSLLAGGGPDAALVGLQPRCGTLSASLTRDDVTTTITPTNAAQFGLEPDFFIDDCSNPDAGILGAIRNNQAELLGTLQGVTVSRGAETCEMALGDLLEFTYEIMPFADCSAAAELKAQLSVSGQVAANPAVVVEDLATGVPDTRSERQSGSDTNTITLTHHPDCVAMSCPFSDDFNRGDNNDIGYPWVERERHVDDVVIASGAARLRDDATDDGQQTEYEADMTISNIDVAGSSSISLRYAWTKYGTAKTEPGVHDDRLNVWYRFDNDAWVLRHLVDAWDNNNNQNPSTHLLPSTLDENVFAPEEWVITVPPGRSTVDVRFALRVSGSTDGAKIDYVEVICQQD
jgi:hypothetical protein